MKTYENIYKLVGKIPKGKIATYGQIAQILGLDPRQIGWALNKLAPRRRGTTEPRCCGACVPWHRVINSRGGISTNKVLNIPLGLQKKLLEKEGMRFNKEEKIDLKKYQWKFKPSKVLI